MRQCPLCATPYDDAVEFCPLDGRVLLPADELLGKTLGGKYRIEAIAGSGGQGTVYRAVHLRLERAVAIKVVKAETLDQENAVARFYREARAVANIRHPHIVTIYDFDVDPTAGAYLVMEYLEGHSLFAELRSRGKLPIDAVLDVMGQVCSGVHAAHLEGLVHRDLKPENVFVESRADGTTSVKVLDFGVAKMRKVMADADAMADGAPSHAGTVMGTPAYMAPEQAKGRPVDARADVYALGCVLYEMLVGRPPFGRGDVVDLLFSHCYDPPPVASEHENSVPPSLDLVIRRALAKQPEDRFQSADEMKQALAAIWRPPSGGVEPVEISSSESHVFDTTGLATYAGEALLDLEQSTATVLRTKNNLPAAVNSFVGRETEIGAIRRLLASNRLVSLTGPSGCGKTRLSQQAALDLLPTFRDGVWLVELAPLSDPGLVPQAIASIFGIRDAPGRQLVDQIREALAQKKLLLVLDNCEHLLAVCATVATQLLRGCPGVRMLATTQQPLGVAGEVTWAVPGLDVPSDDVASDVAVAAGSEAVRLFVERATACNPRFALTEESVGPVVRICRQLDGIPLAIELAAARARMLPVDQIAERLEDRFRLLTTGDRSAQPRQRTLQAAMDWSFDLLEDLERTVFMRLSVFAGGFSLEAAEEVCEGEGLDRIDVFDALGMLVDKSLVTSADRNGEYRYSMLNTVRHYGAQHLQKSGDASRVRGRHRDVFLALAERTSESLRGPELQAKLDHLETEHDNFRAALDWSQTDAKESDALLRLSASLRGFWMIRGYSNEGLSWLSRALEFREFGAKKVVATALLGAGALARFVGRYDEAMAWIKDSLALWRELDDLSGMASALNHLGATYQRVGDYAKAFDSFTQSLDAARAADDSWEAASALNNLGIIARMQGDYADSVVRFWESLALFRELADDREVANTLNNLGALAGMGGDVGECERLLRESLDLRRAIGDKAGIANSLMNLGEVSRIKRDYANAIVYLAESVTAHLKLDDLRGVAYSIEGFVEVACGLDLFEDALRLAGAGAALRRKLGAPLSPSEQAEHLAHLERARSNVPASRAEELFDVGKSLSLRRTIELTRAVAAAGPKVERNA